MIQFNLLPDVKLDYIRTKRIKRLMIGVSTLVASSSFVIALLLFGYVNFVQKNHLNDLDRDISVAAKNITGTKDIDKIITVQNQLASLPQLHDGKPKASSLFLFLSQLTPAEVSVATIDVDFTTSIITLSGNAKDLLRVNTFIDTLKFTSFTVDGQKKNAFGNVLLAGFSPGDLAPEKGTDAKEATFQSTLTFDPLIFNNETNTKLNVPNAVTTRSQLSNPAALFETQETEITEEGNN